ncbi:hypothetical protein HYW42_02185 [Candidatus Daviesbacteria bacterium]|nr:hypothetical protein [Candidatus Daviesbacteria bacterium]
MLFQSKKPHYQYLKSKWGAKDRQLQNQLWENHQDSLNWLGKTFPIKHLALGSLGGLMLLTTPATQALPSPENHLSLPGLMDSYDKNVFLAGKLKDLVPEEVRPLTSDEEKDIAQVLTVNLGFKVTPEFEGKRLDRNYGFIGGEQHLYRFPGDSIYKHTDNAQDWVMYGPAGIAPNLGAWGYFAPSQKEFSETDKLKEKYYLAIPTFLSSGYAERVVEYRDFFKFRKMLVVNPKTGQAVVAVIGDAGPSTWTGKHLGGSPEVMHYLGLATGPRKGAVVYFFIDDPEGKIPLGPVKFGNDNIARI